jgi:hypothetical protein
MKMIKESAFDSSDKQYPPRQAAAVWKQLAYVHQQEGESLVQYYNHFAEVVEHVERLYGMITPSVVAEKDKTVKRLDEVKASKAREKMLVVLLMECANKGFRPLLHDLESDHALGANLYPATLADALQVMMVHEAQLAYKLIMKKLSKEKKKEAELVEIPEFRFMMSKTEMMKKGLCFRCGKKGHKAHECNNNRGGAESGDDNGQQHMQTQEHPFSWQD